MGYPLYIINGNTVFTDLRVQVAAIQASSNLTAQQQKDQISAVKTTLLGPINVAIKGATIAAQPPTVAAAPRDVSQFAQLHVDQWVSYVGSHASWYAHEHVRPPGTIISPAYTLPQVVDENKADLKQPNRGMLGVIGEALLVATLHHLGHSRDDFVQLKITNKKRFPDFAIVRPSAALQSHFPTGSFPVDYMPIEVKTSSLGRKVKMNGGPTSQHSALGPIKEAATQIDSFWESSAVPPGPSLIFFASRDLHIRTFNLFLVAGR